MMARPRGGEWLHDEIATLKKSGVQVVVSLLETSEIMELGLQLEGEACAASGIAFLNFPIPDRGIPFSENAFRQMLLEVEQLLKEEKHVVVHCRMGIGRTGMTVAALLLRQGGNPNLVFSDISKERTLQVPDTELQKSWILSRKWMRQDN